MLHWVQHFTYLTSDELNMQGDTIQPWCTPFPIWNQSVVPCLVLTVASWPAYNFLRRQVMWSGIPVSFRIFHSLLWSTQSILHSQWSRSRRFFWNSLAFSMIQWILAIWFLVPLSLLDPAWTSGSSRFMYCWRLDWRSLSINLLACEMSTIVQ